MSREHEPSRSVLPIDAQPCIWMSAGLVAYKLCDRDFDCEHCPLDAALSGPTEATEIASFETLTSLPFPDDRTYSRGHLWTQPTGDGQVRVGLDAFAAALLSNVEAIRKDDDAVCALDLGRGTVVLRLPVVADRWLLNPTLSDKPQVAVESPYGLGWLATAAALTASADREAPLLTASEARQKTSADLARFRRRVAMAMLSNTPPLGAVLQDGGEHLTDLRQILGSGVYFRLIQELMGVEIINKAV
jgi:glycine cleavage system H lipoate-binding protein